MSNDAQFSVRYAETYDLLHQAKTYGDEVDFVSRLATEAMGRKPGNVLDVACGTGKHLVEFAQRGIAVHGNDLSEGMLACSKRRLHDKGIRDFHLTHGPMQDVKPLHASVDLVTAFYTALGYLAEPAELERFFRNLQTLLKPGACFFADLWNMHKMATQFSPSRTKTAENEQLLVRRESSVTHVANKNALKVDFKFDIEEKARGAKESFTESHLVRYHSVPEMDNLFRAYGFRLVKSGPYFDEAKRSEDSWNFFVLAQRV